METEKKARQASLDEKKLSPVYQPPAIIYEGEITVRAGTVIPPGAGPSGPFNGPFGSG